MAISAGSPASSSARGRERAKPHRHGLPGQHPGNRCSLPAKPAGATGRRTRKREDTMANSSARLLCGLLLSSVALRPLTARAEPPKLPVPTVDQSAVAQRGYFYVGGKYVGEPGKEIMQGQIYVEVLAPRDVRRPYPLVLIHGAAQTATNWMGTPDGRKGWAEYFVEQGYVVYMIDQPMRGRSAWHPGARPHA